MKLTKFLFENDAIDKKPEVVFMAVKEAAQKFPRFWKHLIYEVENRIGYRDDKDWWFDHDEDNGLGDNNGKDLSLEQKHEVKVELKKALNKSIIVLSNTPIIIYTNILSKDHPEDVFITSVAEAHSFRDICISHHNVDEFETHLHHFQHEPFLKDGA